MLWFLLNIWTTRPSTTSSLVAALSSEDPRWPLNRNCFLYQKPKKSFKVTTNFVHRTGWCRCDRQEDHCRHIWRLGSSRWWGFLWQRLLKGRPIRCLRCPLGGQVSGESQTVQESSGSGECSLICTEAKAVWRWSVFEAKTWSDLPVYVLQVSYAIGVAQPLSISLFTYGSSEKSETELLQIVNKNFDLRPGVIVR